MKTSNKLLFLIISIWAILAIVFGVFDLEISKTVANTNSSWGKLGTTICSPVRDALLFIVVLILIGSFFTKKIQRDIGHLALLINFLNLILYIIDRSQSRLLYPIISIIFVISFLILTFNKDWKNYVKIAVMVLLLHMTLKVIVEINKVIFGRVRYRELSSNYTEYTQWYVINGSNSESRGFPSGHSIYGWLFLPFLILTKNKNMEKSTKILIIVSVISYGTFISMSRIIIGAHYCSDILFSTGMVLVLTILLYKKFYPENIQPK